MYIHIHTRKYIHIYIDIYLFIWTHLIFILVHMYKYIGNCYFKSTDGHENKWSFSLSRMNLNFARAVGTETFIYRLDGNDTVYEYR